MPSPPRFSLHFLRPVAQVLAFALLALPVALGCRPVAAPLEPEREDPGGAPIEFAFGTTDGRELSSATTRGRATAILFVTTYDIASQLLAQRLESVIHSHVPRANAGAVVLEAPKYAELATAYRSTLSLSYPVAMADSATLTGGGPFGTIGQVPTLVVLDRSGREVWRTTGVPDAREIERALALGSRRGSAPPP